MQFDQSIIDGLLAKPTESRNVELKRWIDPREPSGAAKIIKGCLALRNFNGGYMLIGFDDKTMKPHDTDKPSDVDAAFHPDVIQDLLSRHASELFEVGVTYGTDLKGHPVIVVPPGVTAPVAVKRDLVHEKKLLVKLGSVYFRTLQANNTVSSSEARPEDWREIVGICFDNREADIGRFLRRQLGSHDFTSVIEFLSQSRSAPPTPTLRDRTAQFLAEGKTRFQTALSRRPSLTIAETALLNKGTWDVAMVIDPPVSGGPPDRQFLRKLASSNPNYTGWPVWMDSEMSGDERNRPTVLDGGWESLIFSISEGWSEHLDFWRWTPTGEFYLHRVLQDDGVPSKVAPGTALDPVLVVLRVAEAIAVGITYARALGCDAQSTTLGFSFAWQGLAGRQLSRWADPYTMSTHGRAVQDSVETYIDLSLDTPLTAIAPAVDSAVRELFAVFDGSALSYDVVEHWVRRLIERKLF